MRFMAPLAKRYRKLTSVEALREHLQWAVSLELSTIPAYLCAYYSIKDPRSAAARIILGVALEEMLHLMLASNVLNAVGGEPSVTGDAAPAYPTFMAHHAAGGPFIQLQRASRDLIANVFMQIEQPHTGRRLAELHEGDTYETIGQFYEAIEEGLILCSALGNIFTGDERRQQTKAYFGAGGGRLIAVADLESSLRAIREIVAQGEGARDGAWEGYGTDRPEGPPPVGSYGRNARGQELAHYYMFEGIAAGDVAIPETYPMETNFRTSHFKEERSRALSDLFNACYVATLRSLESALRSPAADGSFFAATFPLMHTVLPPLARLLLQTPLRPPNIIDSPDVAGGKASDLLAPILATGAPSFEYVVWSYEEIRSKIDALCGAPPDDASTFDGYQRLFLTTLSGVAATLDRIPSSAVAL
jgi:rubrerythrin